MKGRAGAWLLAGLGLASCGESPIATSPPPGASFPMPSPREGSGLLGRPFELDGIESWIGDPWSYEDVPKALLVRFWTDTCPFCEASLPALQGLADEFGPRGLRTLGLYHPKPPRTVPPSEVQEAARERGYRGKLALDPDWRVLRKVWLDGDDRRATSASFLMDRTGKIRFLLPGPLFHPPGEDHGLGDPQIAVGDYRDLRSAIEILLEEP